MAKDSWIDHSRLLPARRRWALVNLLARSAHNFQTHRTGRNATLVAHFGFLAVFPLFLVLTTVLGFVLQNYPKLQERIVASAFNRVPIIGQQVGSDPSKLKGSTVVLIIGLLVATWAGLKAFNALQIALDDVAEVDLDDRPNLLRTRLRSLLGIAIVGTSQIGGAVLTSFIGVSGVPGVFKLLFAVAAVALNAAVLAATYRWLCVRPQSWRQVAPGAAFAGFLFALLQVAGTAVVARSIANASPVYGTFASVIGLITWLGLHSTVALLGAELNHALPARRYEG